MASTPGRASATKPGGESGALAAYAPPRAVVSEQPVLPAPSRRPRQAPHGTRVLDWRRAFAAANWMSHQLAVAALVPSLLFVQLL